MSDEVLISTPCPNHGATYIHHTTGRCTLCERLHSVVGRFSSGHATGHNRVHKRDNDGLTPESELVKYPGKLTSKNVGDFLGFLDRVANNPVKSAILASELRRPSTSSKARHGVAIRSAGREPMLNADPKSIMSGERVVTSARWKVHKTIQIKPLTSKAARFNGQGRNSDWSVKEWKVWSLQYAPGFVIVNHLGLESPVVKSWKQAKEMITLAGYEVID